MILEAVGQKNEEFLRSHASRLCQDQLVVDGDECPFDPILTHTHTFPHQNEQWEEETDNNTANPPVEKEIFPPNNSENQGEAAADQKEDDRRKDNGHNHGKPVVDILKAHIGHPIEQDRDPHQRQTGEQEQQDERPFL